MRLLRGQNGQPSWAVTLAVPALILLTVRYLAGGHEVVVSSVSVKVALNPAGPPERGDPRRNDREVVRAGHDKAPK